MYNENIGIIMLVAEALVKIDDIKIAKSYCLFSKSLLN
jgi:hypothetical protein